MNESQWVSSYISKHKLKTATGMGPEVLVRWAAAGALRSRAEEWKKDFGATEKNVVLPNDFWLGTPVAQNGNRLETYSSTEWESGIFECFYEEKNPWIDGEPPYKHVAKFVSFSNDDLERCIANLSIGARGKLRDNNRPLPEAKLKHWFDNLDTDIKEKMSQEALLELCRTTHSDYSISRDRIRKLTPNRDRGPKPITR
jgi:hypothetical protein